MGRESAASSAARSRPASPHPPRRHRILAVAAAATALSAWAGAVGLASSALTLGRGLDGRLPFDSVVFGGAALALVVAVPFTAVAALAWRDDRRTGSAASVAGVLLMGWIVVELAFIREASFFHPVFFLVGLLFVIAGRHTVRRHPDRDDHPATEVGS